MTALAIAMATGGKVPAEVWEELAGDAQAAAELAYRAASARREARISAKYGFE